MMIRKLFGKPFASPESLPISLLGAVCTLLGFSAVVAWHLGLVPLLRLRPSYPLFHYNSALAFFLLGMALLARGAGKPRLPLFFAALTAVLSVVSVVLQWRRMPLGIEQFLSDTYQAANATPSGGIGMALSLSLFLASFCLALEQKPSRRSAATVGCLATVIAAIGATALLGYFIELPGAYHWAGPVGIEPQSAFGLVVLGLGIFALTAQGKLSGSRWPAGEAALGLGLITILLWTAASRKETSDFQDEMTSETMQLRDRLIAGMEAQLEPLFRMSERWETGRPPRGEWEKEGMLYLRHFPAYLSLEWRTDDLTSRWRLPSGGPRFELPENALPLGDGLSSFPGPSPHLSMVMPLVNQGNPDGFLVAHLDGRLLVETVLQEHPTPGLGLSLKQGIVDIFTKSMTHPLLWARTTLPLSLGGIGWRLEVLPSAELFASSRTFLPEAVLALGSLLTLLVSSLIHFSRTARKRAGESEAMNVELRKHIEERELAEKRLIQKTEALSRSEEALRRQSKILQSILDNMAEGVAVADETGKLILFNAAAGRILGHEAENKMVRDLRLTDLELPLPRALKGEVVAEEEHYLSSTSGKGSWVSVNARPLREHGGPVQGGVAVFRDITERKKAELALVRAREAALEASRLKSDFVANMSHEIRTPLSAVVGMTSLLMETSLDEEQRKFTRTLKVSADALLMLVNDILDFSKIEAGKLELESVPFNLRELVGELSELLGYLAREKGLSFGVSVAENLPAAYMGDPVRLRQVLVNLVGNAIKFTAKGRVDCRIEGALRGDSWQLEFAVTDTGIGIDGATRARLFQSFSQGDSSTTRNYGGTGLGLTISKRLVEAMGGGIGFDSEKGKGSTFRFHVKLPAVAVTGETPRSGPPRKGLKILLAEDNVINQEVTAKTLRRLGLGVDVVSNGEEALEALRGTSYDLVLMDCQMPILDGYSAAVEIRREEKGAKRTPIVALTAHATEKDRQKCLDSGMDDYLSKPIVPALLLRTIERWTAPRKIRAQVLESGVFEKLMALDNEEPLKFLERMVAMFIDESRLKLAEIEAAGDDRQRIGKTAHSLKSSAGDLGAARLRSTCSRLEKCAASGTKERLEVLRRRLARDVREAARAMKDKLAALKESRAA